MINKQKITAIILSAGNSTRYGKNRNKNFELLNNRTVLSYSLSAFNKNEYVDDIIIAVKENEIEVVTDIINEEKLLKKIRLIAGGSSRCESVYNCVKNTDAKYVIIHDAARPLIKQKYINKCLENMNFYPGVTVVVRAKDTVKISDDNNMILSTTNRNNTWLIQTPQSFDRQILLDSHKNSKDVNITDDCALLEKNNYTIKIVEGDYTNIKITTCEDIKILTYLLNN